MTEEETKTLMERHEITAEPRTVYHYGGHRYDRLEDAVKYAELVAERAREALAGRG